MRIAINGLGVNGGGGKTYLENFLPALSHVDPKSQYFVMARPSAIASLPDCGPNIQYVPSPLSSGGLNRLLVEQAWLPAWLINKKIDLLYSPADSTSLLARCPVVLAMRNMNLYVRRDKGWALPFKIKFSTLGAFARISSKIAKKVIFVSHASRNTISRQLGIDLEKQEVIYHGVSPIFSEEGGEIPSELPWIQSRAPYVLSVSSVYRYKNYVRLIQAFAQFQKDASRNYHLIIAGKPYDKPYFEEMKRTIEKTGLASRVFLAGEVPYRHLPVLYRHAKLFAFPSYLETFGHPLVEAMASGVPIIAADIENSREISGGAAMYFDPRSVGDLARALTQALENKRVREDLSRKGKARAANFSWNKCAQETATVFQKAVMS